MAASTSSDDNPLLAQLVALTKSIQALAEHPRPATPVASVLDSTDADRIRQRVTFGYQVLGTLTGRVSSPSGTEFDVPVVRAKRVGTKIEFTQLPPDAAWVALRTGTKVELLSITKGDPGEGTVTSTFKATELIGSMVFLQESEGPLIAFGRRLLAAGDRVASSEPQPT